MKHLKRKVWIPVKNEYGTVEEKPYWSRDIYRRREIIGDKWDKVMKKMKAREEK